jgi:hypothetical protein
MGRRVLPSRGAGSLLSEVETAFLDLRSLSFMFARVMVLDIGVTVETEWPDPGTRAHPPCGGFAFAIYETIRPSAVKRSGLWTR